MIKAAFIDIDKVLIFKGDLYKKPGFIKEFNDNRYICEKTIELLNKISSKGVKIYNPTGRRTTNINRIQRFNNDSELIDGKKYHVANIPTNGVACEQGNVILIPDFKKKVWAIDLDYSSIFNNVIGDLSYINEKYSKVLSIAFKGMPKDDYISLFEQHKNKGLLWELEKELKHKVKDWNNNYRTALDEYKIKIKVTSKGRLTSTRIGFFDFNNQIIERGENYEIDFEDLYEEVLNNSQYILSNDSSLKDNIKVVKHSGFIDFLPSKAGKGSAVKYLCRKNNISLDDTVAIGDDHNDIEMLNSVKVPYTYANSNVEDFVEGKKGYVIGKSEEKYLATNKILQHIIDSINK
jgi:HAD superfamily hydrolase (TIGR01484 family)